MPKRRWELSYIVPLTRTRVGPRTGTRYDVTVIIEMWRKMTIWGYPKYKQIERLAKPGECDE